MDVLNFNRESSKFYAVSLHLGFAVRRLLLVWFGRGLYIVDDLGEAGELLVFVYCMYFIWLPYFKSSTE